jgi:hypothetical protein
MNYAKIQNTTLIAYPYTFGDFVKDNNNTSYPAGVDWVALFPETAAAMGGYALASVEPVQRPSYDSTTQICTEGTPVLVNGSWEQTWAVSDLPLATAQNNKTKQIQQAYGIATDYVPVTINGTDYQVDNTAGKQALNLSLAITANGVAQSPAWTASTAYTAGVSLCNVGGVILFCSASGKSGSSAPTPPAAFGTPVTDGTATWELMGRKVYLQNGSFVLMTPQQILSAFQQGELYLHQTSNRLESLLAQINAETTVSAVQAVVW